MTVSLLREQPGNDAYDWDRFDPEWYVSHNYQRLRDDDHQLLNWVREFFGSELRADRPVERGVDVGSGANLYPALAMLPYCHEIDLREHGAQNVRWLRDQISDYEPLWDKYWDSLASGTDYRAIDDPRVLFAKRVGVRRSDLFKLPVRRWDVGTMFFVAESISRQEREFKNAVAQFIRSLRVGAPFAIAFMKESAGYFVGDPAKGEQVEFPAVSVTEADVRHTLEPLAPDVQTRVVESGEPLRHGYQGMILAVGKVQRPV
jgi:NNMT/PNMT/TEMT family protein